MKNAAAAFDEAELARLIIQLVPEFSAASGNDEQNDPSVVPWNREEKEVS